VYIVWDCLFTNATAYPHEESAAENVRRVTLVGKPFATVHFSLVGELSVLFPCGFVGSAPEPAGEALPDDCASRKTMRNAATTISTGPKRKIRE